MTHHPAQGGITLIELLVAVVIVAILAAVAVPSYQAYLARGDRAQAIAILMENAQFLERNYTVANRFDQNAVGSALALPFPTSPKPGEGAPRYNIVTAGAAVNATDPNQAFPATSLHNFTLTAVPVAGNNDACGTLLLTETGVRGVTGAGATVAVCWR